MNTAPLQNPATLLAAAPPTGHKPAAAETPFNQLLSKEVAQRASADAKAPAPSGDAQRSADGRAEAQVEQRDDRADEADTAATAATATPASAELLALVADLQRGAGAGHGDEADPATTAADGVDARIAALVEDRNGGRARLAADGAALPAAELAPAADGKMLLPAAAADTDAAADAEAGAAARQQSAFGAALKQAADTQPAADTAAARAADTAPVTTAALAPSLVQAAHNAGAVAAAAGDKLTPQVGTPAWDSALGQKVVWMVAGGQQSAALTLNPPDLGPLQVVLHVNNSQASATFVSAQPEVRQALEAALPRLREMMSDAGIQLGQANVGADMPNQQQAAEQSARHAARGLGSAGGSADPAPAALPARQTVVGGRGLVDTFA